MTNKVDEIAPRIYRLSTLAPQIGPGSAATIERLADLAPTTLALMHGSSFNGDCGRALRDLAGDHRRRATTTAS